MIFWGLWNPQPLGQSVKYGQNKFLEGQLYADSGDELDDPFNDAEILMSVSGL